MATLAVTGRADLTDAQWAVLEPLLPRGRKPGRPPEWTKTAAHQRDPVAGPGRCAVAGRAAGLWAVADGVWPVPPLAAQRHLAGDPDRPAGQGGCGRADHLGRVGGFHRGAGAPACRRSAQAGGSAGRAARRGRYRAGRSRPGPVPRRADHQNPPGLRAAGRNRCRWSSPAASAATARSSRSCWAGSAFRGPAAGGPGPGRTGRWPIRPGVPRQPRVPAAPRDPVHYPGQGRPDPPPQEQGQRQRPAARVRPGPVQAAPRRGNAASTGSNATAPSPPAMTNSPSATKPPSTSPPSTNGSYPTYETRPSAALPHAVSTGPLPPGGERILRRTTEGNAHA